MLYKAKTAATAPRARAAIEPSTLEAAPVNVAGPDEEAELAPLLAVRDAVAVAATDEAWDAEAETAPVAEPDPEAAAELAPADADLLVERVELRALELPEAEAVDEAAAEELEDEYPEVALQARLYNGTPLELTPKDGEAPWSLRMYHQKLTPRCSSSQATCCQKVSALATLGTA